VLIKHCSGAAGPSPHAKEATKIERELGRRADLRSSGTDFRINACNPIHGNDPVTLAATIYQLGQGRMTQLLNSRKFIGG
jgi:hypothetical protein